MDTRSAKNVVILLSGGLDSTVLLHSVARENAIIHALCVNYGQRHIREMECARYQADCADAASFHVLDMHYLGNFLGLTSSLIHGGRAVPSLDMITETERDQPSTYVPNRNMVLLSLAAAYAESMGAAVVYYGAQRQDEYGYWDCTPIFLERINALLALNRRKSVQVAAPLINNSKSDNVLLGMQLGVDFGKTWSCYRGEAAACGTCPTCIERLNAFAAAGHADPLPYVGK